MYSYRSRPKQSPFSVLVKRNALPVAVMLFGASLASFGFLMPAVSGTSGNGRVFSDGLKISLDRTSPAFAALEDAWSTQQSPDLIPADNSLHAKTYELVSGISSAAHVAQQILRDNHREQNLIAQERASREANSEALTQAAGEVLKNLASHFSTPPQVEVANNTQPAPQRKVVKTISLTDLQMSREELFGSLLLPIANSGQPRRLLRMPSLASHPVVREVNYPNTPPDSTGVAMAQPPTDAKLPGDIEKIQNDESPTLAKPQAAMLAQQKHAAALSAAGKPQSATLRQVVISGPIEFGDGLALSNTMDRVVIYRDVDGETQESGQVWVREGRYEIFVEETAGLLTGELRTPYGDVVGRGTVDLSGLTITSATQRAVTAVNLKITPVLQGISGRVLSARTDGSLPGLKSATIALQDIDLEARSFKGGGFTEPNLVEGSTVMLKASHPNYWDTIAFGRTGISNDLKVMPDQEGQMARQLLKLTRATGIEQNTGGLVWGRALKNGKPVAGAAVEILQTAGAELHAIYFDAQMIPDAALTQTSANGVYAFYPVPAGPHAIHIAFSEESGTEPLFFSVLAHTVSQMDVEATVTRIAKVKVFDAFKTDLPLATDLTNPALPLATTQVTSTGTADYKFTDGDSPLIVDSDSGRGYEKTRVSMSRDRRSLYVPMISSQWLAKVRGKARINTDQSTGTIIGFVQGSTVYKVAIANSGVATGARVVYFNNNGDLTPDDYGQPGGGFIVFGVQEGFRTVTVQGAGSPKVHAAVTLVDHNVTNVLSHWIR